MIFIIFIVNPVLPSPINLHVSDVTNTTIEVTWEQSSSSKITGYDVTIDSNGKTYSIGRRRRFASVLLSITYIF